MSTMQKETTGPAFKKHARKILSVLLIALCGAALGVGGAEALLRIWLAKTTANESPAFTGMQRPRLTGDICLQALRRVEEENEYRRFSRTPKRSQEKRAFIIGESVADQFSPAVLRQGLRESFPGGAWETCNFGTGGYDSFLTLLTLRETLRCRPDLVVVLLGNNEGRRHLGPVTRLLGKYDLLTRSAILRFAAEYEMSRTDWNTPDGIADGFAKNVREMIRRADRENVPLVFVTLPNNRKMSRRWLNRIVDRQEYFAPWWLVFKDPGKAAALLASRTDLWNAPAADPAAPDAARRFRSAADGDRVYRWALGTAYERLGDRAAAARWFAVNSDEGLAQRNALLRRLTAGDRNVALVDFDAAVNRAFGQAPDHTMFLDEVHFRPPVYAWLTRELLRTLSSAGFRDRLPAAKIPASAGDDTSVMEAALRECRATAHEKLLGFPDGFDDFFGGRLKKGFESRRNILAAYAALDPAAAKVFLRPGRNGDYLDDCVIGEVLREQGDTAAALTVLDRAAARSDAGYEAFLFRGLCRYDAGRKDLAAQDFTRMRELNPAMVWLTTAWLDSLLAG